jgi:hypothetical protein
MTWPVGVVNSDAYDAAETGQLDMAESGDAADD